MNVRAQTARHNKANVNTHCNEVLNSNVCFCEKKLNYTTKIITDRKTLRRRKEPGCKVLRLV